MNVSFDKIAPPVAFVVVGLIMVLIGAAGVIPIGTPQPEIVEPVYRVLLVGLGIVLIILATFFVWRESKQIKDVPQSSTQGNSSEKTQVNSLM